MNPDQTTRSAGSNPASILVVDDEEDVTTLVAYNLRAKGYRVDAFNDPVVALKHARATPPDLVILDIMMPEMDGIQLCRALRTDAKLEGVSVIFLSAKTEESDRIRGLEVGADDYVCKPFSPKELLLRVGSVLRRHGRQHDVLRIRTLQVGDVELDLELHRVRVEGQAVELTATEFRLLQVLMERKGRVQAREHLLHNVWRYESEIETRTIDTHVHRVREKLGREASLIETVRGVGYRMVDRKPGACSP